MTNKNYLARLQTAIKHLHGCGATWRETVPVHEVFRGQTIWKGDVEVFDLEGHPDAKRCYGWSRPDGPENKGERLVTVLENSPVISPQTAVRASIVDDSKQGIT